MRFALVLVLPLLLGVVVETPAFACGDGASDTAPPVDPMPTALVVEGSAMSIDVRDPAAPMLYVAYPKVPGQTQQLLYGGNFRVASTPALGLVAGRIARREIAQVRLTRGAAGEPWHVALIG